MPKPPGPPPQPIPLRILRGNPGKRPIGYAPQPEKPPEPPLPPSFMVDEFARAEWFRISGLLHGLNLLTWIDLNPLAAYCTSVARWRRAEALLLLAANKDPVAHGLLVKNADGTSRANPLPRGA